MNDNALDFFKRLLATPSPSGYEANKQDLVREYVADFADEVRTDVHGNVIAIRNPTAPVRIMFAGHCDQIGMLVSHITDEGFVYAQTIGGWDPQQLIGQRMTIWTAQGAVPAVIARRAIHLLKPEERTQVVKLEDMWLDIGAASGDEARELVHIGDPVTLALGFQPLRNNLANAPAMDNTCGLWVVMEALRRVESSLACGVFAVSTVQEEIGLRGVTTSAYGIAPHVGVAVDVTHATDTPDSDPRMLGKITVGGGPVIFRGPNMNPLVVERLRAVAQQRELPCQLAAVGRGASNDANRLQLTREGVATGLVSIPNRYMHSAVETISLDDIDHAADLLAGLVATIGPNDSFIPKSSPSISSPSSSSPSSSSPSIGG